MTLLTIKQAAEAAGVSYWTIKRLVEDAYVSKKSRWQEGREFVNLSVPTAKRRVIRIRPDAVGLDPSSA